MVALYRMRVQGYCKKKADDERNQYYPNTLLRGIKRNSIKKENRLPVRIDVGRNGQ